MNMYANTTHTIRVIDTNTGDWTTRTLTGYLAQARMTLDEMRAIVINTPVLTARHAERCIDTARGAVEGLSIDELRSLGYALAGMSHKDLVDHLVWTSVATLAYSRTAGQ